MDNKAEEAAKKLLDDILKREKGKCERITQHAHHLSTGDPWGPSASDWRDAEKTEYEQTLKIITEHLIKLLEEK